MRKTFNLKTGKTLILDLMMGQTPDEIIAECRNAEFDGADGIAFEMADLNPEFRNVESYKQIIDSVALPFMTLHYRNDRKVDPVPDDDARTEELLLTLEAGAGMIDVMGDLYDPSPDQCALKPDAVKKQMKLIEEIHSKGGQVIMSSHPLRYMTTEEVITQLKRFADRGADVVKIVTKANSEEEFAGNVLTTMKIRHALKTPFVHLCGGSFGRIQRFAGINLGLALTFAVHEYHFPNSPYNQPPVTAFKAVQNNVHWNIQDVIPLEDL